jgi:hypothetical protein
MKRREEFGAMFEVKIKVRFQNEDVLVEEEKPREPTREIEPSI